MASYAVGAGSLAVAASRAARLAVPGSEATAMLSAMSRSLASSSSSSSSSKLWNRCHGSTPPAAATCRRSSALAASIGAAAAAARAGRSSTGCGHGHQLRGLSTAAPASANAGALWGSSGKALQVIDCHAGGEPARVIVGGLPNVPGRTMLEKRAHMMQHMDHFRKLLLLEPRGYPCQNANFILPPTRRDAAYGYVIAEQNAVYPAMSGHNTICVATALLETGMVAMEEPVTEFNLEAPGGLIGVSARCSGGKAVEVTLRSVPSFCRPRDMDVVVDVPEVGKVRMDIAYGGMHYAIVHAADVGLAPLVPARGREICRLGEMIKVAAREQHPVQHPEIDYPGCDILVFREGAERRGNRLRARNAVVMSNTTLDWSRPETWTGMIDRSPCGTGTCAVMASLYARGELALHEPFEHESIVGSVFVGRLVEETVVGAGEDSVRAVVPTITGSAWITQHCTVVVHPSDPFPEGFTVGDIW